MPSFEALHLMNFLNWTSVWQLFWAVLSVWLFGAVTGLLMPRPKWLTNSNSISALLFSTTAGLRLRQIALAFQGAVILRELWYQCTCPESLRKLLVLMKLSSASASSADSNSVHEGDLHSSSDDSWHVSEKDLAFFHFHGLGSGSQPGPDEWEKMMEKDVPNAIKYTAWRRLLPSGRTEYKSVTICPDATAQEFSDMYMDDDYRPSWDTMIVHHEVVEHGDFADRKQVVRWIRRFPFSFLREREYIIARRAFKQDDMFYGITKAVNHVRTPKNQSIVRVETFHSMWGIRDVACPWGSGKPACETVLLHHEDFKIPENLARFAVRHAMWGFVKKMSEKIPGFVKIRRERCGSYALDRQAYGSAFKPNPPFHCNSILSTSTLSLQSCDKSEAGDQPDAGGMEDAYTPRAAAPGPPKPRRALRALAMAGAVVLAVGLGCQTTAGGRKSPEGAPRPARRARSAHRHPHNVRV